MMTFREWLMPARGPDMVIGPPDDPYMLRWFLLPRNRFFNVYLHHIRKDDDDRALHDHPWASLSYMLEGSLIEVKPDDVLKKYGGLNTFFLEHIHAGQWKYRSASQAHRLCLPESETDGAWTLFVTGPRIRQWGFHCPKGWRHWKDFVQPDRPGEIGRGCGELE